MSYMEFKLYLKIIWVNFSANYSMSSCSNFYNLGSCLITFSNVSPLWGISLLTLGLEWIYCNWFFAVFYTFFLFGGGFWCNVSLEYISLEILSILFRLRFFLGVVFDFFDFFGLRLFWVFLKLLQYVPEK